MIKWFYISFFISALLFKPISQVSWEIWYAVNQSYVAEELCENQDQPEMQCNGKCYLMKQLSKAESGKEDSEEAPMNNPFSKESTIVLDQPKSENLQFSFATEVDQQFLPSYINFYQGTVLSGVFHPPCA